ncbi:lauroyl-Kdo(2)-lipid IV(A) myristoyltransferase [Thaumasiovibrio subtropicus]|uniref:lauroyl-Kdo(2)-lipid IV(A) myristoyltransferase n=1 Tax=Thaumasiovibrio subtropicus TaxID=1891207 RepID=UPI000B359088|nr:lauroyl-Kdo(2)-lipid IV(A) myristoyltransferase [Thaumasiovibrio subtropicus]
MTDTRNDYDPTAYNPEFGRHYLAPKHWGTWLAILLGIPLALSPNRFRVWIAKKAATYLVKKRRGSIYKAWYNLSICFPEKSDAERNAILHRCLTIAGAYLLGFASLSLRSRRWFQRNSVIHGIENLTQYTDNDEKVILLVPHTWAIDIGAILLASHGLPVVGFTNAQRNPLLDYLMHRQRVQYGGRIYDRSAGIKAFIKAIRQGYLGYYLPDQDHGPDNSVFVDFFATTKATLPGLGKLKKLCRAHVVPITSTYNIETGQYEVRILPAVTDIPSGDETQDARRMNQYIEEMLADDPAQYMWILKLFKTQPDGKDPYIGH